MNLPNLPSEITYGALLAYSPRGISEVSKRSRSFVRDGVKHDVGGILTKAAELLVRQLDSGLATFFDERSILVPVPRSRPIPEGGLWPSLRICEEIRKVGLGKEILPCLKRTVAVQKSSFASPGGRLSPVDHLETLECQGGNILPQKITLVDDFITRGSILLACAALVQQHYPNAEVRAFALVRTCGFIPEIEKLTEPVVGCITNSFGVPKREP